MLVSIRFPRATNNRSTFHGRPLPLEVIAVRADGTPLTEPGQATVRVFKAENRTVRVQGAGGVLRYRTETELKLVAEMEAARQPAVRADSFAASSAATNSATFTPPEAGSYLLEATTKDSAGRAVVTKVSFYASAAERAETAWDYRNGAQIELVADRKLYRPGDTAMILAKSGSSSRLPRGASTNQNPWSNNNAE